MNILFLPLLWSAASSWNKLGPWSLSISSWFDCLKNGVALTFLFKGSSAALDCGLSSTLPNAAPLASLGFLLSVVKPRLTSLRKIYENKILMQIYRSVTKRFHYDKTNNIKSWFIYVWFLEYESLNGLVFFFESISIFVVYITACKLSIFISF